jgi:regulator of cell morphogenesis and NO signaling
MTGKSKTVGELTAENAAFVEVFEKFGIDYCCGGGLSLEEACSNAGVETKRIEELLEKAEGDSATSKATETDFTSMSLAALCDHIVRRHHTFTRRENERITGLLEKVSAVHGGHHAELFEIQKHFGVLRLELENHLLKEERVLFPYIAFMESSLNFGKPVPTAPFGSTRNPVAVMVEDHDAASEFLRKIRGLTEDFAIPADACTSYKMLYNALEEFERDLHLHIHLENNILFPKAVEMEMGGISVDPDRVDDIESDLPVLKPRHHVG